MRVEILGSGHRDIVNGSRFYDEQQRGLGNYGPSFKSVDSPFRPVVKVVALIAA